MYIIILYYFKKEIENLLGVKFLPTSYFLETKESPVYRYVPYLDTDRHESMISILNGTFKSLPRSRVPQPCDLRILLRLIIRFSFYKLETK